MRNLLMAEEFEMTCSSSVYVDLMNTDHPLLVNDLNVQGNLLIQVIAICKGDEQLVGHVHRYICCLHLDLSKPGPWPTIFKAYHQNKNVSQEKFHSYHLICKNCETFQPQKISIILRIFPHC